ncbi:hypothetical protein [Paracoccus contaminans]|uniref:hypothetical protein n=1 Tax=Paracoccus contaminans TaxID=1945662 RepID=UPI0012F49EC5|nr:hypothetical protein [Paracoccus contaminans]
MAMTGACDSSAGASSAMTGGWAEAPSSPMATSCPSRAVGAGAIATRSAGGAFSPAATLLTARPVRSVSSPPGSSGATRASPSTARITGTPETSRTTS